MTLSRPHDGSRRGRATTMTGLLALTTACTGNIVGDASDQDPAPSSSPVPTEKPGARPSVSGQTAPDPMRDPPTLPAPASCASAPGPASLRRLTNAEYARTVRDLLGATPLTIDLPADARVAGFDNDASGGVVSPLGIRSYMDMAEKIAASLLADGERRAQLVGCDPTGSARAMCLRSFVQGFGRRAYRRPLAAEEVDALLKVANASVPTDGWAAIGGVVQAMLQSPSFLLRAETGHADATVAGGQRLTGFELATRLGYLLHGSTPGQALLAAAEAGQLDTPDGLARVVSEALEDARAKEGLRAFHTQWLRGAEVADVDRDPTTFPLWTAALRASVAEESARLVDGLLWNGGGKSLVALLLTARHTFVDVHLAKLYGVPAPAAGAWARVDLAGGPRAGLLTHASFLAVSSSGEATPIVRGKLVREIFTCDTPPAPPAAVPSIPAARPGETARQRLERHRSDPACSACHAYLDPVGFGLARFDEIGTYHDKDEEGRAIDDSGRLEGHGSPAFTGAVELGERLATHPKVGSCLASHLFRYAFGRAPIDADACTIDTIARAFEASGGDLRAALAAAATSPAFRTLSRGESR